MMMPANYSVIAENEMTYVVGGGVIEAIGAVTAPIWTAANVKTFNTNIVTIVGNAKLQNVVNKTLGTVAAVYNLGNATVANKAGDTVLFKGPADKKAYKGTIGGKDFFVTEA